jgi:hypothetical protein
MLRPGDSEHKWHSVLWELEGKMKAPDKGWLAVNMSLLKTKMGNGSCRIGGCGCQAFNAAPGGSGTHCIGRNAAGGTCNHSKDEHN